MSDTGPTGQADGGASGGQPGKGFRARKREDHALALIDELRESLSDLSRVKQILLKLGRFYDPVLGGSIFDLEHQRQILAALETSRRAEAEALIETRYALYLKDRVHLGRRDDL
jgi:hypothetical protein